MATTIVHKGNPGTCYQCNGKAEYGGWDDWPNDGHTYVIAYNCTVCQISWREYYNYLGYRKDKID